MDDAAVLTLGSEAVKVMIYVAAPMLIAAMGIGILISVLQAITQINEATLTFIPKILAVILVLVVMAPWMLKTLTEYASSVFGNFDMWVR